MFRQVFVTALFFSLAIIGSARADSKIDGAVGWGPGHWEKDYKFQPYIEHPTQPQHQQWRRDPWQPYQWATQYDGGGQQVIDGFYTADILRKQYVKNGTAAVDVGPGFYMLSGNDKRKVAAMIDYVYGITKNDLYGLYTLYDWNNHRPIGTYTQYGLEMQ